MSQLPEFAIRLPLRCCWIASAPGAVACGRPASAFRGGPESAVHGFVCGRHMRPGDVAIGRDVVFRRVRVNGCIDFAAVTWDRRQAHAEVAARLERAVADAGGLLNVLGVGSVIGRHRAERPVLGRTASGGEA